MRIYTDIKLCGFEFWGGALYTSEVLTEEDFEIIESILEEENPSGMTENELNDFFRFEENTIAKWLGYNNFEELKKARLEE